MYPEDKASTTASTSAVKTAALIGAIAGQLTMGYVGDWLGRSRAMGITMGLTIVGALLSSIQKASAARALPPPALALCPRGCRAACPAKRRASEAGNVQQRTL